MAAWFDARLDGFNKIQEISTEISKGSVLDEVLNRIYDTFHVIIPYDRIGCALISDDYERVFAHWAKSNYPGKIMIKKGYTAFLSGSSLEGVLTTQQPRILNDLQLYLAENPNSLSTKLIVSEGIQSSLTCPLIADGKPIGFLFFSSKEKNTYIDAHQKTFINLASQISFLVEKSRLYQSIYDLNNQLVNALAQLKEQSSRDALTGVFHRGAIMEFLKNTIEKDTRKKQPTTVILADIDHFKHVNDTYGHVAGDTALKEVSKSLTNHLRSHDCVGRYGGEEFLIILGETNATDALLIIERIRQAISDLKFERNEGNFSVTMSFGIACSDNTSHIKTEETLLLEADSALYHAKNEGRNRVCIA
ncbi:sensor domain-containing diguanylate cyclase [Enterobacter hormaechei]|uniref:sensor domain-containing diguanylate cyclase n=1 Tax=Enterobacter hormaechei TaxID=158836 RepID=UPI0034DD09B9